MRGRKIVEVICCLFLFASGLATAQEVGFEPDLDELFSSMEIPSFEEENHGFWSSVEVNGYLKNETAYRIREPRSITKIRNIVYLNTQAPLADDVGFNMSAWAYYDHAYDLFNYETIAARLERNSDEPLAFVENLPQEKDSPVATVRELYLDLSLDNVDLRLGKQYIIWGVLEGVRIVDEINPQDFRELILPDLLDYRISLWSLKVDMFSDWGDLQLVVIPELKFHKAAPQGSEWELLQDVPGTRKPASWQLENTELGVRWARDISDVELTLSYFYTWDDFPVIFRTVKIDGREPEFFPTYTRISMWGTTAVKQVGPFILKGELAYVEGKFFGKSNTADVDNDGYVDTNGVAQKNHIRWGAGVDVVVFGWDASFGATQWIILDYEDELIQEKQDTSLNIFVRREFPKYSMTAQALWIYLKELNEVYIKPKITFQLTNEFQMAVGMDLFDGQRSDFGTASEFLENNFSSEIQRAQFIGNFHNNDRIFFEFKYSF